MDDRRFDGISRRLAAAGSRRAAVKAALAVALGGAALTADDAAARPALCRPAGRYCTSNRQCCNGKCRTGKRVPVASRNICDCDAPFGMCGKMCRDLSSDPNHCGTCGNRVGPDERCCDGVPTPIDADNCAACGDVCGPDDLCCAETGGCLDSQTDPNNCGACGVVCESGECVDGACLEPAAQCDFGLADGAACVNAIDCCSLNCSGGTCAAPGVDCSTYDGSNGMFCYRVLGQTLGVAAAETDLVCGTLYSSVSYASETCASNADCQTYLTTDGVSNLVPLCIDQGYVCGGQICKSMIVSPQCMFLYTEGASC